MTTPDNTYRGEKPISLRPGAMDAYSLPSRVGDDLVKHGLPISMAARGAGKAAGEEGVMA